MDLLEAPDAQGAAVAGGQGLGAGAALLRRWGDIMRLSAMNTTLSAIGAELRAKLESVYQDRLVRVILYGSQARGDADAGSDMDVLVVLKSPVQPSKEISRLGPFLTNLSLAHDTLVSCAFVSEERFREEQSPFLMNVRREGVAL